MLRLLFGTTVILTVAVTPFFYFEPAAAMPAFAREYGVSCNVCHAAYPRLNAFGETFAGDMNMRLPNWKEHTVQTGDEQLALSDSLPLAMRLQAFIQGRDGESIDPVSGAVEGDASVDFQAPYLVKLLTPEWALLHRSPEQGALHIGRHRRCFLKSLPPLFADSFLLIMRQRSELLHRTPGTGKARASDRATDPPV